MPRQTKRSAELEKRCDPQLLTPCTTDTGEKCYLRTDRPAHKLRLMYHADGRAMVRWADMQKYWLHLALHPNNAITIGRFATPAEISAREAADKAALEAQMKTWEK